MSKDASKLSCFGFFLSREFSSAWQALATSSCFLLLPEALFVSEIGIFRELGPASGEGVFVPGSRGAERMKSGGKTAMGCGCDSDGGNEEE
jgi:hypothetical protein